MNDVPSNVVGGDLNKVWRVANVHFPKVENVYWEQIQEVHKVNAEHDVLKYGQCHPRWTMLAGQLEVALFRSAASLDTAAASLNRAVDAYTHVDGDGAGELNDLGNQLESIIDSEDSEVVDSDVPEGYDGPNLVNPLSVMFPWAGVNQDD